MEELSIKNPWLGLESYKEGEVLYGRDEDIRDLSQSVLNDPDTLLYGKSGIGKSSILNAGIIPAARRHDFLPVLIRLSHKETQSYLCQIKDAIANAILPIPSDESGNQRPFTDEEQRQRKTELGKLITEVVECKDTDKESLYEFFHRHTFHNSDGERIKLLVIFDQFEEIFSLQTDESAKKRFFAELADFLNDIMPAHLQHDMIATTTPQKKIIVSGTDNFDNLFKDLNFGAENRLPEYVTDNEIHLVFTIREDFLSEFEFYTSSIPSLKQNRYGLRPISEEQAAQIIMRPMPGLIDESVAKLIIEKVSGRNDFELDGIPEIEVDSAVLSLYLNRLYDAKSGNKITSELVENKGGEIIADFYSDAISNISESTVEYLEDMLLNGQGRRDNITIFDALNDGGVTDTELDILCNKKKVLRQFNYAGDLRIEYVHDILCPFVKAHKDDRLSIRLQEQERKRQEEEKIQLQAEAEKKRREIEEKAAKEKAELEAESIRAKLRNRKWHAVLSGVIVSIILCFGIYYYCFIQPYSEDYGSVTTRYGWPVGLGKQIVSPVEKEQCTIYYRLTRPGRLPSFWGKSRPFTKVQVLNWKGDSAMNALFCSPMVRLIDKELEDVKAKEFATLLSQVSTLLYFPGANEELSMSTAYDISGKKLYSEKYSSTNGSGVSANQVLWCIMSDRKGNTLQVSDKGTDRIRYTISNGYITGCSFFTALETPQPNTIGHYGYYYQVDTVSGNIKTRYAVDKYGDKIDSTLTHYTLFNHGRDTKNDICSIIYAKQSVIWKYNNHADSIHICPNGFVDKICVSVNDSIEIRASYLSQGKLLKKEKLLHQSLTDSKTCFYSSGQLDSICYFDSKREKNIVVEKYAYPSKNIMEKTFWSGGEKIMWPYWNGGSEEIWCHKIRTATTINSSQQTVTTTFYDKVNAPTKGNYSKMTVVTDTASGNVLFRYFYNYKGDIYKSIMFTYNEYGICESRSVAGIDRKPVRCPKWDIDGLNYYNMRFLTNDYLDDGYLIVKGIDEFSKEVPILDREGNAFRCEDIPVKMLQEKPSDNEVMRGVAINKVSLGSIDNHKCAAFIHVLHKKGSFYNSVPLISNFAIRGIADGDIIEQINGINVMSNYFPQYNQIDELMDDLEQHGGNITILRFKDGNYIAIPMEIKKGQTGAEYHISPISDEMFNAISKVNK